VLKLHFPATQDNRPAPNIKTAKKQKEHETFEKLTDNTVFEYSVLCGKDLFAD